MKEIIRLGYEAVATWAQDRRREEWRRAAMAGPPSVSQKQVKAEAEQGPKRILIADEDPIIRNQIRNKLERTRGHYKVQMSTSVADTRAWCEGGPIDLLIIDLGGAGVVFGEEQHRQGKKVIITAAAVKSASNAPQIQKGGANFLNELRSKAEKLLAT